MPLYRGPKLVGTFLDEMTPITEEQEKKLLEWVRNSKKVAFLEDYR